jgi:hypothetical protein
MTEQKLMNPSLEEKSTVEESGITWKDLQGLGWIFSEEEF